MASKKRVAIGMGICVILILAIAIAVGLGVGLHRLLSTTTSGQCPYTASKMKIRNTDRNTRSVRSSETPISYHGGPVMNNPVMYLIWYGNWTGNNGTTIIENFARGLGSTPWWNITRQYNNTSPITFGNSTTDSYSQGKYLTDLSIFSIVTQAINSSALPNDTNGIYFVLTSSDCTQTEFCTSDCGWHNYNAQSGLIYSWVGDATELCPLDCFAQQVSPNGNVGADAMVSVIAHEAAEAVSDPYINAWIDSNCDEIADKCSWTFGNTTQLSNGANYSMFVNGLPYLVQQIWRLSTQDCGLS